jgi:Spy/CpxP family protein refolding chaperone
MKTINSPVSSRFGLSRAILLAAPCVVVFAGQAAAAPHPESRLESNVRVLAAPAAESGTLVAPQPVRERMARRLDRWRAFQERRSRREDRAGPARWVGRRMASALELTDEQRDQLREAMREIGDRRRDSRRQVADARRSFRRAAHDRERSVEEVQTLGEALGRAQADQVLQRRSERERIAAILTDEQRERLDEMRERRGQREPRERRARRGRRRG